MKYYISLEFSILILPIEVIAVGSGLSDDKKVISLKFPLLKQLGSLPWISMRSECCSFSIYIQLLWEVWCNILKNIICLEIGCANQIHQQISLGLPECFLWSSYVRMLPVEDVWSLYGNVFQGCFIPFTWKDGSKYLTFWLSQARNTEKKIRGYARRAAVRMLWWVWEVLAM